MDFCLFPQVFAVQMANGAALGTFLAVFGQFSSGEGTTAEAVRAGGHQSNTEILAAAE